MKNPFKKNYVVFGPQGGLSTSLTLPEGFNPQTGKCPMVILVHGFLARKSMYPIKSMAKRLASEGIASISFDCNGHGKSEGRFIEMTVPKVIADLRAVFEYVKTLPYVSDIAFLGHSQGGLAAGMLAGMLEEEGDTRKPSCMVMMAPAAAIKYDALAGCSLGVKYDPANPPEYVRMFVFKLGREYIQTAQQLPIYEESGKYKGKVCLIQGTEDKIVKPSYSEKYHESFESSELHLLEGEGHMLTKDKEAVLGIALSFLKANLDKK